MHYHIFSCTSLKMMYIHPTIFRLRVILKITNSIRYTYNLILILIGILQKGEQSNAELRILTEELGRIRYGDNEARIKHISIRGLLPDTEHYMTYEGSTTAPGCHETVTWIVLNKPIYIVQSQVSFTTDSFVLLLQVQLQLSSSIL